MALYESNHIFDGLEVGKSRSDLRIVPYLDTHGASDVYQNGAVANYKNGTIANETVDKKTNISLTRIGSKVVSVVSGEVGLLRQATIEVRDNVGAAVLSFVDKHSSTENDALFYRSSRLMFFDKDKHIEGEPESGFVFKDNLQIRTLKMTPQESAERNLMHQNGSYIKNGRDPKATFIGRLLRRSGLDDLVGDRVMRRRIVGAVRPMDKNELFSEAMDAVAINDNGEDLRHHIPKDLIVGTFSTAKANGVRSYSNDSQRIGWLKAAIENEAPEGIFRVAKALIAPFVLNEERSAKKLQEYISEPIAIPKEPT